MSGRMYSQVTGSELYHRSQVAPGVVLVTGPGGSGMTMAPAIAEETFARPAPAGQALTGQIAAGQTAANPDTSLSARRDDPQ